MPPVPINQVLQAAGLKNGDLLQAFNTKPVYLIERNKKRLFPNRASLDAYIAQHGHQPIKRRQLAVVQRIPLGTPMPAAGDAGGADKAKIQALLHSVPPIALQPPPPPPQDIGVSPENAQGLIYSIRRQQVTASETVSEFSFLNEPSLDAMWPGCLVQGKGLAEGHLDLIGLGRAPGMITIATNFVGAQSTHQTHRLDHPSAATVQSAITEMLHALNPSDAALLASRLSTQARTEAHGLLKVGFGLSIGKLTLNANVDYDTTGRTSTVMHRFNQVFYTVVFEPDTGPTPYFFSDDVKLADVEPICGPGNPPCYVSFVNYGRSLLIIATGAFSKEELHVAVDGKYGDTVKGNVNSQHDQTLEASHVQVFAQGGSGARGQLLALANPADELAQYITDGLKFSLDNPGSPISFQTRYVSDLALARVSRQVGYKEPVEVSLPNVVGAAAPPIAEGNDAAPRVPTGLIVSNGDRVTIHGGGRIWAGVMFTGQNGPAGWADLAGPRFPIPNQPVFSLIAGFSEDSFAGWREIGALGSFTYLDAQPAQLLLGINDDVVQTGSGAFTATVDITRHDPKHDFPGVGSTTA